MVDRGIGHDSLPEGIRIADALLAFRLRKPIQGFDGVDVGGQKVMKPNSEVIEELNCFRLMGLRQNRSNGHRAVDNGPHSSRDSRIS
jgi:hypothetical protein